VRFELEFLLSLALVIPGSGHGTQRRLDGGIRAAPSAISDVAGLIMFGFPHRRPSPRWAVGQLSPTAEVETHAEDVVVGGGLDGVLAAVKSPASTSVRGRLALVQRRLAVGRFAVDARDGVVAFCGTE